MQLIEIKNDGTPDPAIPLSGEALEVCEATAALYHREGFVPPWIGYLAVEGSSIVGTCAFKSPPRNNRAEIAYHTFARHEGKGLATEMARRLVAIARGASPGITIFAQTQPVENASNRIVQNLGFRFLGPVSHPTDGEAWEWELAPTEMVPDFAPVAELYSRARPVYPPEFFLYLHDRAAGEALAWDCATGTGQAAAGLARVFNKVHATDISAEQLKYAVEHPRITYRQAPASRSGLEDNSADIVTVGSAIHWLDIPVFLEEAKRVLKPGGLLAIWTYHIAHTGDPYGRILNHLYTNHLFNDFGHGARHVDARYENLELPGAFTPKEEFEARAEFDFQQMEEFIQSWSGSVAYNKRTGRNPVDIVRRELQKEWGSPEFVRTLTFPMYVRLVRF
jgi:ubiquinone/menaquinone biosynthesis C-methylase UbiE/RimJ/RimL family protein N-acetyltransferase